MNKLGSGTLTLTAGNTYTGNTSINAGAISLADNAGLKFVIGTSGTNNRITGSGDLTLDGDFLFNLSGAGSNPGDNWTIVDLATLGAVTFGNTFQVTGFTESGNVWTSSEYQFSELTGVLTVIPEPSSWGSLFLGVIWIAALRRRRAGLQYSP